MLFLLLFRYKIISIVSISDTPTAMLLYRLQQFPQVSSIEGKKKKKNSKWDAGGIEYIKFSIKT